VSETATEHTVQGLLIHVWYVEDQILMHSISVAAFFFLNLQSLKCILISSYILNKQSRSAEKGSSSSLGVGRGVNNASP
jgi:hypothetical protein